MTYNKQASSKVLNKRKLHERGNYISHFRFADDIVILYEQPKKLETMKNTLNLESHKNGLEINPCKTKIMINKQPKKRYYHRRNLHRICR